MIDITNKQTRKELINRYIYAETSIYEERILTEYFLSHNADEDEIAIAQMLKMESLNSNMLSDKGVAEYDSITKKSKWSTLKLTYWIGGIAAGIALIISLNLFSTRQNSFNTSEIAQELQQLMNLEMNEIMSITATPMEGGVWVKVELSDGSIKTFIMTKELDKTSLLAII